MGACEHSCVCVCVCVCWNVNDWMSYFEFSVWVCARVNVCTLWCPHLSLSMSSLVCICPPSHLTGDLDGHWWDHASWHSSEASPLSLVRHVEPCVDPPSLPPAPLSPPLSLTLSLLPSLSVSLSLLSPVPCPPGVFLSFHVSFVLFTPLHVVFSVFSFCFLSHTCRGQSKGKKKNY